MYELTHVNINTFVKEISPKASLFMQLKTSAIFLKM